MAGRGCAINNDFSVFIGHQFKRSVPYLLGGNVDRSRKMPLAKIIGRKRFDQNGLSRMVELLLEFVPFDPRNHWHLHSLGLRMPAVSKGMSVLTLQYQAAFPRCRRAQKP